MKMFKSALMLGLLLAGPSFAQSGTGSQTGSSDPKTTVPTTPPDSTRSTGSDKSTASDRTAPMPDDSLGSQKKKSSKAKTSGTETTDPAADPSKGDSKKP